MFLRRKAVCTEKPSRPAMFESLEKRQMMAVSPVLAGSKVRTQNLFGSNNISLNESILTIPFSGNVNIADASKLQVRGYAINPLTGRQRKMVIGVVKAEVLAADHRFLQIPTDRLMRKGGKIILYSGGLKDDSGNFLAEQTVSALQGQNIQRFTLACRSWFLTDMTKYSNSLFPASPTPTTANTPPADDVIASNLGGFLQKKVDLGIITTDQKNAALTRFNSALAKAIIPSANLRAALISLTGTFAESAIGVFLDGNNLSGKPYTSVSFGTPPDTSVPVAQSIISSSTGRIRTVIWDKFAGEPFQALSVHLAHEALHQDTDNFLFEEEFATTTETLVYAQQVIAFKGFVSSGTALVARENEYLLALLQSGRVPFPYIGTKDAPIRNAAAGIFPGSTTPAGGVYTSYTNLIERQYLARGAPQKSSAGNATLNAYYTKIKGTAAPAGLTFSKALIDQVDALQLIIGTKDACFALAGALRLKVV